MVTILSALVALLSFRVRSRTSLELELIALRHLLIALRRQHPHRVRLFAADQVLWMWLHRVRPQILNTLVPVKPATVGGFTPPMPRRRCGSRLKNTGQSRLSGLALSQLLGPIRAARNVPFYTDNVRPESY
jgi:hypothetical protein